jgi:hypothetical protein
MFLNGRTAILFSLACFILSSCRSENDDALPKIENTEKIV